MTRAMLVVKTLKVLCPDCGTEVGPPILGATEWTPEIVGMMVAKQREADYEYIEHAPMCAGCGAFLEIPVAHSRTVHLTRPHWLAVPEPEEVTSGSSGI